MAASSIFNYNPGGAVYTRANGVAGQDGMVGAPYDALKQACFGAQRDRLLVVQYETLTADPAKTMHAPLPPAELLIADTDRRTHG